MNYRLLLKIVLSLLILIVIFFLSTLLFFLIYRRDNGYFNTLFTSSKYLYKTYSSSSLKCQITGSDSGNNIKPGQTVQDINFFNLLFVVAVGISIIVVIYFLVKFLSNSFSYSYQDPEQAVYRRRREIIREEEMKEEAIMKEKEQVEFNSLDRTDQELFLALKKRDKKSFF